jgi:hypothetical protein
MAAPALRILAGPVALRRLREEGFDRDAFRAMLGASGGAKWLVLGRLDRQVVRHVVGGRREKLFLLGSSIGSWRLSCYARSDPDAALERFEAAYFAQRYDARPTPAQVSDQSRRILEEMLGTAGPAEVLSHPKVRFSVMAVRARNLAALEPRLVQQAGLLLAAAANALSRRALGLFFERALFHDPRDPLPFRLPEGFPAARIALTEANFVDAVLASGSIPAVLSGVRDIPGAPPGVYRDGGVVDYHFDYPATDEGLVLYPHFYPHVVPGWFDKFLPWRRVRGEALERVVLLCPSRDFVADLPGGRIPDRRDFWDFDTAERLDRWRRAVDASRRLADEFAELVESGGFAARAEPIPAT